MEFLSKQLKQIAVHLGDLSRSQQMALALCVVLLVVGGAWMLQWSGMPQFVPLLDQPMKAEELAAIENWLRTSGDAFRTAGGQVLVRAGERTRLQGMIAQAGLMPADTSIGFTKLIEEANLWIPREESRWQRKIALANELAKVVAHFDGVSEARVFLDLPERRGFGDAAGAPTASVFLRTRASAQLDKARVSAIAALVSGAVHGLKPDEVKVVDATTGRSFRVPAAEDSVPFDLLDLRRQKEEYYGRKVLAQLSFIPGVLVGVNVELDSERRREHVEKLGPPVVSEEQSITSESQGAAAALGPGTRPNTRAAISSPGSAESTTSEESRTSLLGERDRSITDTDNTPGTVRLVRASVNVPRSYFVSVYRQLSGGKEPGEKELGRLMEDEEKRIRAQVKPLIGARDDEQVQVSWFHYAAGQPAAQTREAATSEGVASMLTNYGRDAGLLGLAAFSLVMVLRFARRAGGPALGGGAAAEAPPASGGRAEGGGGRTGGGRNSEKQGPVFTPVVDEAVVQAQRIADQITEMVEKDPESAAMILRRWVTQTK